MDKFDKKAKEWLDAQTTAFIDPPAKAARIQVAETDGAKQELNDKPNRKTSTKTKGK